MIVLDAPSKPRRHLFVCGVGRSGTTALARCLNRLQAHADNPRNGWSRRNDFAEAIAQWNDAMKATMLTKTVLGRDLVVVLFEDMFARGLRRLLSKLDLASGEMGNITDLVEVWQSAVGHDARTYPAQLRYAEERLDHSTYEWFKKEAQT